jgi:hypothetical protein
MKKGGKGKGRVNEALGSLRMRYRLAAFHSFPVPRPAGQPTFVVVAANEAGRYFATSVF